MEEGENRSHSLASFTGFERIAECFFFTSSTFEAIRSTLPRISSTCKASSSLSSCKDSPCQQASPVVLWDGVSPSGLLNLQFACHHWKAAIAPSSLLCVRRGTTRGRRDKNQERAKKAAIDELLRLPLRQRVRLPQWASAKNKTGLEGESQEGKAMLPITHSSRSSLPPPSLPRTPPRLACMSRRAAPRQWHGLSLTKDRVKALPHSEQSWKSIHMTPSDRTPIAWSRSP